MIKIVMQNLGCRPYHVAKRQRIAQLVIMPCVDFLPIEVDQLPPTIRNAGCFGSTNHFELVDSFPPQSQQPIVPFQK